MKILSLYVGHDASACILDNGKIIYYQMDERLSRRKHEFDLDNVLSQIYEKGHCYFNSIVVTYLKYAENLIDEIIIPFIDSNFEYEKLITDKFNHHKYHAYCGFYNSNFEKALCFSLDGAGSFYENSSLREIESVFLLSKNKKEEEIFKHFHVLSEQNFFEDQKIKTSNELSVGWEFEKLCEEIGFHFLDAGKVMGLAQYKNHISDLPYGFNDDLWISKVEKSHIVQNRTQRKVIELIKKYVNITGVKNVVISGGYGLNCVSNYEYLSSIEDINLHIDPICFDAGISIGSAYYYTKDSITPLSNVYIGHREDEYNLKGLDCKKVEYSDIVELIISGKVVAIFQGKSEAGQRALGNRSLLFDPRHKDGKTIVNKIKRRENFRPFAGTVLLEHSKEWFNMKTLEESPYMLYAVDVYEDKCSKIPAVIHVDNTCRIQTITETQNIHFYNLILEFYKKTNIPILLNTSFNLAGEPLVDSFYDAIDTLNRSEIEYLYLPEISTLVNIKNKI